MPVYGDPALAVERLVLMTTREAVHPFIKLSPCRRRAYANHTTHPMPAAEMTRGVARKKGGVTQSRV